MPEPNEPHRRWNRWFALLCALLTVQVSAAFVVLVLFLSGRTTFAETTELGSLLKVSLIGEIILLLLYHLLREKPPRDEDPDLHTDL